ncbi:MAG TPA: cupredoxin domain-containing protein [Gemmatimonadaceae bacterium]|nr:cupredoxin domain-containing protein [Gemmatimonadaceae bacterium]
MIGGQQMVIRNWRSMVGAAAVLLGCGGGAREHVPATGSARSREIVITTVPLLTKELVGVYPFLKADFSAGGVLGGKEVYEFMPSTITVNQGDTLRLTFINPEDDAHSFVMTDLSVALPGESVTHATYVARRAGIFDFVCAIPTHSPMMRGQLVVLSREASRSD